MKKFIIGLLLFSYFFMIYMNPVWSSEGQLEMESFRCDKTCCG